MVTVLKWLCDTLAAAAVLGMLATAAVDVLGRIIANAPLGFAFELVGVMLGLSLYSGLTTSCLERIHVRIDLTDRFFNARPRIEAWRQAFSDLLTMIFVTLLAVFVLRQAGTVARYGETYLFLPAPKAWSLALFGTLIVLAATVCWVLFFRSVRRIGAAR